VTALLLLAGCLGPPPLSKWNGCLHEGARLDDELGILHVGDGDGWVVNASATWGDLPFVTDTGRYRWLLIALPQPSAGVVDLAERRAQFRDGAMFAGYDSRTLTGTVEVVELGDRVTVRLDARATAPVRDDHDVNEIALVGDLALRRVVGARCR
jgi:hypothetical protein